MPRVRAASTATPAVELNLVTKAFGEVIAVDEMTLAIGDGEFFSLLGPSGCGKTTTLRMIAGFEQPSAGDIRIKGQPVTGIPAYRRPVNTVFQNYALFPHMTVYQNVAFGLEMSKVDKPETKRRVNEILELVRLPEMGERKPKQLSGGQQQRVALARALVNRPMVLLLDEPLGALDLKLRKAMQLELKQIQSEVGITFIYVTHDQEEALTMSNRIAVMNLGVVQQIGRPKEIYEHPSNRFVADFIGETNFVEGTIYSTGDPAQIAIGDIVALGIADGRDLRGGQSVTLAIRPEKIDLLARGNARLEKNFFSEEEFVQLNTGPTPFLVNTPGAIGAAGIKKSHVVLEGQISEAIYIGTDTRYRVRFAGDVELFVRMQNFGTRYDASFDVGDEVLIHWMASNAQVLTE